jgi:hypothetical protein
MTSAEYAAAALPEVCKYFSGLWSLKEAIPDIVKASFDIGEAMEREEMKRDSLRRSKL